MAGTKVNPDDVWGPNEYSAQRLNLTRADQSTVGPGGNTVDRNRINKTMGGSGAQTQPKPLGTPESRG